MQRLAATIFATLIIALSLAAGPVAAAPPINPSPVYQNWTALGHVTLSAGTSSANVALPAAGGSTLRVCNRSTTIDAYIALGADNTAVATVAGGSLVEPGICHPYSVNATGTPYAYLAAITGSSTASLYIEAGNGSPVAFNNLVPGSSGSPPCIAFGTTSGTCAEGDDPRIVGALQAAVTNLTPASADLVFGPNPCVGICTLLHSAPINTIATTSYTLQPGDATQLVLVTNASAKAVALPQAGTAGYTAGYGSSTINAGAAAETVTPQGGSKLNGTTSALAIPQWAGADFYNDGTDWYALLHNMLSSPSQIQGMGTGCATWLATPSSANLAGCVTDESGTGALLFAGGNIGAATGSSLVLSGSMSVGAASVLNWTGLTKESSPADGTVLFCNNACSGFTRILFGGATSSFPALNVSGTTLVARLGDNSANAGLTAGALGATGAVTFTGVTTGTNADFACFAAGGVMTLQTSSCTISSKRFKDMGPDFTGSALSMLARLPVGVFTMKGPPNADPNFKHLQMGLYAEDVAAMDPRCAIYENDMKTPKSYRQECIIALLVKGEQELKTANDKIAARQDLPTIDTIIMMVAMVLLGVASSLALGDRR